jgi:hypothetical protein
MIGMWSRLALALAAIAVGACGGRQASVARPAVAEVNAWPELAAAARGYEEVSTGLSPLLGTLANRPEVDLAGFGGWETLARSGHSLEDPERFAGLDEVVNVGKCRMVGAPPLERAHHVVRGVFELSELRLARALLAGLDGKTEEATAAVTGTLAVARLLLRCSGIGVGDLQLTVAIYREALGVAEWLVRRGVADSELAALRDAVAADPALVEARLAAVDRTRGQVMANLRTWRGSWASNLVGAARWMRTLSGYLVESKGSAWNNVAVRRRAILELVSYRISPA